MGRFTSQQRGLLLGIARAALTNRLVFGQSAAEAVQQAMAAAYAVGQLDPALLDAGACFVTLWQGEHGDLRGCRGEVGAHQPLIRSVAQMALAAALDDPRFAPVTGAEMADLLIEISVLTPLERIEPQAVEIGRHGLLIVRGAHRGLLLPEVAVEHHMDAEAFLEAVCWKAGLPESAWRDPATALWAFEAEAWEEDG